MLPIILLALSSLLTANAQCQSASSLSWKNAPKLDGVSARVVYNGLKTPRGLVVANSTLLVVERGAGITALAENATDCAGGFIKNVVVENTSLTHGIALSGTDLFAASPNQVFRWTYDPATRKVTGDATVVVTNLDPTNAGKTRTLAVSGTGSSAFLIVSAGSNDNLEVAASDAGHGSAQIRRFALNGTIPSGGYPWLDGELVAYGIKNAVGMTLSQDGNSLWALESSVDQVTWNGTDINKSNPAEELNHINLSELGKFYGYPQCVSVWDIAAIVPGSNLTTGDQISIDNSTTDARCQDTSFNVPPRVSFEPHGSPLGVAFYTAPSDRTYALDNSWNSNAFVSFHGSYDVDKPVGYGVVRVPWSGQEPTAAAASSTGYGYIAQAADLSGCPDKCFRPVGLAFDSHGRLFGTSDTTGEVFVIESSTSPDARTQQPGGSSAAPPSRPMAFTALFLSAVTFLFVSFF